MKYKVRCYICSEYEAIKGNMTNKDYFVCSKCKKKRRD